MGKQVIFMMTKKDLDLFLNCINMEKVQLLKLEQDGIDCGTKRLKEISGNEIDTDSSQATYLWNRDFPINNFNNIDLRQFERLPLTELSFYRQGTESLGRIYWNTCYINDCDYDTGKYSKWFESLRRVIGRRAVRSYDDYMKIYVFEDYWDKHKSTLLAEEEKYRFQGRIEDFFERAEGYENIALLKCKSRCYNHCSGCRRITEGYPEHYNQAYCQAFDHIDSGIEIIIAGIGFDPLTSPCLRILEYIRKVSDKKIIMITNGIDDLYSSISCINNTADELYIFIPAQTPEEYLMKTDSGLGLSAYKKAAEFAKKAERYIKQEKCRLNIFLDASRNDVYKYVCEKYGKPSGHGQ